MWSFQGQKAVHAPDQDVEDTYGRFLQRSSNLSSSRPSVSRESVARLSYRGRPSHDRWPRSSSDSTLTDHVQADEIEKKQKVRSAEPGIPGDLTPVRFWSHALKATRQLVFRKYALTLLVLCCFVLGVLSIYWGALFSIQNNLGNATIAVVDFDGQVAPYENIEAIVGPFVAGAVRTATYTPHALGYEFHDPADYDFDPLQVRRAVHHDDIWGAIIINANATALLREAVRIGNTTYDPKGACQLIYNQARDVEAENQYIIPTLLHLAFGISNDFGGIWTQNVLTNTNLSSTTYSTAPQALSPGIAFSVYDIRPFDPPVAIPAVSIGLIYLIIIAFFSFSFFMPIHANFLNPNSTPNKPHPPLRFTHLVAFRYTATITAYLFLSLSYSLVSLAFQIPFSNTPEAPNTKFPTDQVVANANLLGHATWPVYWMLNFVGMAALGLPLEIAAMLLPNGQPWTSLFLIFWVITNVSTGFYALELAPRFYRWGYGWPLRQIVYGSRALLFGTRQQLGLNFGILLAWVVVASLIWVPSCWVLRARMKGKAGGGGVAELLQGWCGAAKVHMGRVLKQGRSGNGNAK